MQREKRRLVAIVAADVAGYSRLIGQDEEGTLRAFRSHRSELIDLLIEEYGGRIANTAGDSLLLEFPSAVDAVRCCIAVQVGLAERNKDVEAGKQIIFRIGVNVGDVVAQGDDLMGDGVNIAARLENLCEPGRIVLSDDAHRQVRDRLETSWEDGGEYEVKNIARPVRVWRWSPTGSSVTATPISNGDDMLPLPDKPSIAVLSFDNMSGDQEQEYLADGISEDIITALSRYHSFFVSARNSTFTYKGAAVDVKRVGRELGVRYVLEGSVRRGGNRIRVTAQLIEAASGNHIWAERYDREIADLFDMQDEITRSIVTTVMPELAEAEYVRASRKPPGNLDAWESYQKGMWHAYRLTEKDLTEAESLLRKSIALDKSFAAPRSGLAFVLQHQSAFGWAESKTSPWAEALHMAREAIRRDEGDALAHAVMARSLMSEDKLDQALRSARQAVAHNENSSFANATLGMALVAANHAPEALSHIDNAIRLSPRDPLRYIFDVTRGCSLVILGRLEDAKQSFGSAASYTNAGFWPFVHLANLHILMDQVDEARLAIDEALALKPDLTISHFRSFSALVGKESLQMYPNNLRLAGLPE